MKTVSLYSGAGGLDIGIKKAGFEIVWANDYSKYACESYAKNIGTHIEHGDINEYLDQVSKLEEVDLVAGGPPCQGFSVAGKMDPNDERSQHVWTFTKVVEMLRPKAFIMENVKALGKLKKWELVRAALLEKFRELGYATSFVVLSATDFDVPQARERVFFIGFKGNSKIVPDLQTMLEPYQIKARTVREVLSVLDRAGSGNNQSICKAKITMASNPVLRKSPYAGMLFNGLGRPVKLDGYCATLPASMGGNKTPIIDEEELYDNKKGWILDYHSTLINGEAAMPYQIAPKRLRRLTVEEASLIQTFPLDYEFCGSQSSKFTQIGNAVPANLGYHVARMVMDCLINEEVENMIIELPIQLQIGV